MIFKCIATFLIFTTVVYASSIEQFAKERKYFTNFESAINHSIDKYKPIMMVVVTGVCLWCKKFENQVLEKKQVDDIIQTSFTPLIINQNKDDYPKETFRTSVVPTTFFIDPLRQSILHTVHGYKSRKDFLNELEIVKKIYYEGN